MTGIRVEVRPNSPISEKAFTDKKGVARKLRLQEAYAHLSGAYPERIELTIWEDGQPFAPGLYNVSLKSVRVSQYRNLELSRSLELEKVPVPAK